MHRLRVTVEGKPYQVTVEVLEEASTRPPGYADAWVPHAQPPPNPVAAAPVAAPSVPVASRPPAGSGAVLSPLAGKVVAVDVKVGMEVTEGAQVVTLEAMKMNTFVYAPKAGRITAVHVNPGDAVEEGAALLTVG